MIEPHVTSREISEWLKELGFDRKSVFGYYYNEAGQCTLVGVITECHVEPHLQFEAPAYLASELGEVLPKHITVFKTGNDWECIYGDYKPITGVCCGHFADTIPNAMGLMLIWLIEKGHMEVSNGS